MAMPSKPTEVRPMSTAPAWTAGTAPADAATSAPSEAGETAPAEAADLGRPRGRVPDFFVVGQPKSGTTALYEFLRHHPQIYMPELKEPVFLASDQRAGLRRATVRARPQTLEEYLSLFAAAGREQRAGEASALYLWSRTAAG